MDERQTLAAQRDRLAHYIFAQGHGTLFRSHCRYEIEAGRCPYHDLPGDAEHAVGVCVPCIVAMIGDGAFAPPSPFLSLLAEHHILVCYFVLGGTLETGRVQVVADGTISFESKGKIKDYHLEEIDVIVPQEVIRWSQGELTPVTWNTAGSEGAEGSIFTCDDITECLLSIGIQPFMDGTVELVAAIRLVLEEPELLEQMGKKFYPAVGQETGEKASTVANRIHKLISTARRNSRDTGKHLEFYNGAIGRSISVKIFILAFLRHMFHGCRKGFWA